MIDQAQDQEQSRLAITLAAARWNLSLMPANERPALLEDSIRKAVGPDQFIDDVLNIMKLLLARKEALFPNDKRVITDYHLSGDSKDDMDVVIEYSLPNQD